MLEQSVHTVAREKFGHILAIWKSRLWMACSQIIEDKGVLVEQRGIEPLASALRTRRSAKLSYCPTRGKNTVSSFEFQVSSFENALTTKTRRHKEQKYLNSRVRLCAFVSWW